MLPSSSGTEHSNNRICCSPSYSTSACVNLPPFSQSSGITSSSRKSMEEVWEDINLASLQDHTNNYYSTRTHTNSSSPGIILQDFLAKPLEQPSMVASVKLSSNQGSDFFGCSEPPYPATVLSLKSGADLEFLKSTGRTIANPVVPEGVCTASLDSSLDCSLDGLGALSFCSCCKKRAFENGDNSGDRRHKRMIKNRESAARSRARKQAYTSELELELAHLLEENAKLRRQQEKFLAATAELPKKHTLYRTSTAPF